jgi:hypothetical protein
VEFELGGFAGARDLNHYCMSRGYKEAYTSKGGSRARDNWICRGGPNSDVDPQSDYIEFVAACAWSHVLRTVTRATPRDDSNAYTWVCFGY